MAFPRTLPLGGSSLILTPNCSICACCNGSTTQVVRPNVTAVNGTTHRDHHRERPDHSARSASAPHGAPVRRRLRLATFPTLAMVRNRLVACADRDPAATLRTLPNKKARQGVSGIIVRKRYLRSAPNQGCVTVVSCIRIIVPTEEMP